MLQLIYVPNKMLANSNSHCGGLDYYS